MPALFARLARAASAVQDRVYAERFLIQGWDAPLVPAPLLANGRPDVNAPPVASTARSGFGFKGVFVAPGTLVQPRGRGMPAETVHGIIAETPMIDIDVAALPERPRRGDIVLREDTGERFEVTDPLKALDFGRGLIALVPLSVGAAP